ncbi:bifunctional folylpolyglutamate synthase/dihydrofolate synthase [Alkalihalobacillus pseudalcaliphilus]|uniref:bifunctional folylpolyglutamate synthase/dihydrofolate synthase n=1 Tax=Alkalihalobacillus pseudalcaliphilus TaxID=79884 RepID=UPI00064D9E01|nr:folylpolyglutamate synthase/dihydrofolate synthase family protein [Alkalihalobacillus pseudalcaliphilus]KMK74647.1 folylpolyglutamate synthase [Alkalihalobacillus pseudalcaliphilus]
MLDSGEKVIEWIHSLLPFGIKPGLKRMEWMLERLEHPENQSTFIHIAGTNGKGSTVSYLRHVLNESGYSVGTFTSPYIERFEERISLNGQPIPEYALVKIANKIRPLVEELAQTELGSPTEFEVITTIAFEYFAEVSNLDFVLLEVGLGGRWDSTNVITPIMSVITSIGHDHMHILGDTIEEITSEKAGIIKKNIPVVSGVLIAEAQQVLRNVARENNAAFYQLQEHFCYEKVKVNEEQQIFHYKGLSERSEVTIRMKGEHQLQNVSVAIQVIELLVAQRLVQVDEHQLRSGLVQTSWVGRFEILSKEPLIVIDGAHNEEGLLALAETLNSQYPTRNYSFVISATKEKDMGVLLKPFEKMNSPFIFTEFEFFKAAKAEKLYQAAPVNVKRCQPNWHKAVLEALSQVKENDMIVITGSLYFISEIRQAYYAGAWDSVISE